MAWLLDATIDGVPYRWSVDRVEVDGLTYDPGLSDLTLARGATDASVTLTDASVDWPTLAEQLDESTATISWWDGTTSEVFVRGQVTVGESGTRDDPVSFAVEDLPGAALGSPVPDPLSRVDGTTWPLAGTLGDEGRVYPLILGYPGYIDGDTWVAVVPAPVGQRTGADATTYVVVSDDAVTRGAASQAFVYNASTDVGAVEDVSAVGDLLGRLVQVAHFTLNPAPRPTGTESADMYVGYFPTVFDLNAPRDAYSVLEYMLRRGRASGVDWSRLRAVRDLLGAFKVDTWIDAPSDDPWAWFEAALLPDLPAEIRTSTRGRYLVGRRYLPDATRRVGSIDVDAGDAAIVGAVARSDTGPTNEFTARFRANREGDWLGTVIVSGSARPESSPTTTAPASSTTQTVAVVRSGRCAASYARYGLRANIGPIDIDWTWDEGTILRVLERYVARDTFRARLVSYRVPHGDELDEGDEVLLTDTPRGFAAAPAIVDGPAVFGSAGITVPFRVPR